MIVGSRYLIRRDEMDDLTPRDLDAMLDTVKALASTGMFRG